MTNVNYVKALIERQFEVLKTEVIDKHQISFEVKKESIHHILNILKLEGWIQLSYLSAIDWIDENEFELVYIVMNWDKAVHVQVRARIDRENPVMDSILPIYEGCKYYERECHEFFGIAFIGNPDYKKQLILENWDDIPPMRKDFDPRAYSDAHFAKREYKEDFVVTNNQESKQEKRNERNLKSIFQKKGGRK